MEIRKLIGNSEGVISHRILFDKPFKCSIKLSIIEYNHKIMDQFFTLSIGKGKKGNFCVGKKTFKPKGKNSGMIVHVKDYSVPFDIEVTLEDSWFIINSGYYYQDNNGYRFQMLQAVGQGMFYKKISEREIHIHISNSKEENYSDLILRLEFIDLLT